MWAPTVWVMANEHQRMLVGRDHMLQGFGSMHYMCATNHMLFLSFWAEHKRVYSQSGSELFSKSVCVCVSSFFWKKGWQCGVQALCSQAELLYLLLAFCIQRVCLPTQVGDRLVQRLALPICYLCCSAPAEYTQSLCTQPREKPDRHIESSN